MGVHLVVVVHLRYSLFLVSDDEVNTRREVGKIDP